MRKMLCTLSAMFLIAGLVAAAEVNFVKYDAETKELKVKEGDKETTYKFAEKVKITATDKDGNASEVTLDDFTEKNLKKVNAKRKYDITVEKDVITEIKYKKGK